MNEVVAIPVTNIQQSCPEVSAHFGHCAGYILVYIHNNEITHTISLPAMPHDHGGCMTPVAILAQKGVTSLLAGGMGMRPLNGFKEAGITVYKINMPTTVDLAIHSFLTNTCLPFSADAVCKGSAHCGGRDHPHDENRLM